MLVQESNQLTLNSSLANLPSHNFQVDKMTLGKVVKDEFDNHPALPGVLITDQPKIIGMISRSKFFEWLSQGIYLDKPILIMWEKIREMSRVNFDLESCPISPLLLLTEVSTINQAVELALKRPENFTYEPVVILYPNGNWKLMDIKILLRAQSRLFELAKQAADTANQAKTEFLANMSHELRTPLNSVIGFAQILRNTALESEQQEYLKIINDSGEHLLSLINNILELSKVETGQINLDETDFDLHSLLQDVQDMFYLKLQEKQLEFILESDSHLPQYVSTDEGKLRQVLINLIANGIKFTEKGQIILRAKVDDQTATDNQYQLHLEVEDTGPGIPSEELDNLFVPFEQATLGRKIKQGSGLGLAITHKFVTLMGGKITIRSRVGVGTCFQLSIPICLSFNKVIVERGTRKKAIALAPGQPNYRILVVDDETDNRLLLLNLLKSVGFCVQEASNGREAIDIWSAWEPHLILMNLQMPQMDGYEATKQIRQWELKLNKQSFFTKIIALTANVFQEHKELVFASGFDEYMVKPFDVEELWEKITLCLGMELIYEQVVEANDKGLKKIICGQQQTTSVDLSVIFKDMPSQWLAELYEASTQLRGKKVMQLIQDIPPEKANLAAQLQTFAENYQFEEIVRLLNYLN